MKVSVIIATYNYGTYLPKALDSVLAQTSSDWECIIIDDGSADGTPGIARAYEQRDARIRYVRQANAGLSAARNHGVSVSRGEYLQMLDADDLLDAAKLERHAAYLDVNPGVDVVYGASLFFYDGRDEETSPIPHTVHLHGNAHALRELQETNPIAVSAALIRRTAFERSGRYNEAVRGLEDWDLWLRAAVAGCRFEYLDAPAVSYTRLHPGSLSSSAERMIAGMIVAARAFPQTPAAQYWHKPFLPLVYELAAGLDAANEGRRWHGAKRMFRAVRHSTSRAVAMRWTTFALAALALPPSAFYWVVTRKPLRRRAANGARHVAEEAS